MSEDKKTEELKQLIVQFAAMGYLAAIFYAQNEDAHALMTVEDMARLLEKFPDIAHAMDPHLEAVAARLGHKVTTHVMQEPSGEIH